MGVTRRAAAPPPHHRALAAQTLAPRTPWKAQTPPDLAVQRRRKPSLRLKKPRWNEESRGRGGSAQLRATRRASRARKCRRWGSSKGGMGRGRTARAAAVQSKSRWSPSNSDLKKFLKYTTTAISQLCGQIYGVSRVQKFSQNIVKFKYQLLCQFYCIPYSL